MSSISGKEPTPSLASTSTTSTLQSFASRMHVPLLGSEKSKCEAKSKESKPKASKPKKELTLEDVLDKAALHSMMSGGHGLGK